MYKFVSIVSYRVGGFKEENTSGECGLTTVSNQIMEHQLQFRRQLIIHVVMVLKVMYISVKSSI